MKVPKKISWVKLWLGLGSDNNGMSVNFAMNVSHIIQNKGTLVVTDTTHNHRQTDSHTLNQYSDSLGSSFLGKNINTYDCFFCYYKGILDCYLMDSCSLNSKLQFSLIFSFIYGVWGAKIRFVSKKIMGKNIGPGGPPPVLEASFLYSLSEWVLSAFFLVICFNRNHFDLAWVHDISLPLSLENISAAVTQTSWLSCLLGVPSLIIFHNFPLLAVLRMSRKSLFSFLSAFLARGFLTFFYLRSLCWIWKKLKWILSLRSDTLKI